MSSAPPPPDQPIGLSPSGPPETVLEPEPADVRHVLAAAASGDPANRRVAVGAAVAQWPRCSQAWADLGDALLSISESSEVPMVVEAYAAYRVGYHRGLDRLRGSGWRGSGYVRWRHEGNQGFLRCVDGLRLMAETIGEDDEAERCALFLRQLDPSWPPADLADG
jgi:hypothetical protein